MPNISFTRVTDPAALASRWLSLEVQANGGFFRSWTYLGTLLPSFTAPHLLAVRHNGQDLALGLFNRARGRLTLHETGDPLWDSLYVEHNGLLLRPGAEPLLPQALAALLPHAPVVLSGIDDLHLRASAAIAEVQTRNVQFAPALDLTALAASGRPYLDTLSANARAQIRRSMRLFGPTLAIHRAASTSEALAYFDRLVALHQAAWIARGHPGAFAEPAIRDVHTTLIRTGFPRGEISLLKITAGDREIGLLYLFHHAASGHGPQAPGARVLSYQSGFAPEADARLKSGLVCHTLAIEQSLADGAAAYDFLAGAQRYKTTLAPLGGETLHWITLHRRGSFRARLNQVKKAIRA